MSSLCAKLWFVLHDEKHTPMAEAGKLDSQQLSFVL